AQNDLVRYKQLVDKEEVSQQQYDQALAAAKASAAAVEAARASAAAAEQQITQAQSKLAQAEANLRSASTAPQQVAAIRSRAQSPWTPTARNTKVTCRASPGRAAQSPACSRQRMPREIM